MDHAHKTDRTYELSPAFQQALSETRKEALQDARNESTLRKWVRRSVNVLLLIAVVGVFLVGYGLIDNRWYRIVAIQGGSMSPTLHAGDAILLTRPPQELEVGMIVTLEVDGSVVTHRVISVEPNGAFSTMGDANSVPDDWGGVDVEVVGVQRARIPFLGKLLTTLASIRGSDAWLLDRSSVSGSTSGTACFGLCGTVSDGTVSDETVSDETVSAETVSAETVSDETVSDETVSDETVSDETVSDGTVSDETPSEVDEAQLDSGNDLHDPDASPGDTIEPPDSGSGAGE